MYTFSGHRNMPGIKGLVIDKDIYYKIDKIYGPSSWTVDWHIKNGSLYADNIEISNDFDIILTRDKRTIKQVLLSTANIIANIGEPIYKGFLADYKSAKERGFDSLASFLEQENITLKYIDNRDAHGCFGIIVNRGVAVYETHFDWPYKRSIEIEHLLEEMIPLIDVKRLQLIFDY